MKLTWFGGVTFRVHVGGQIVVLEAARAPAHVDAAELVSGADRVLSLGDGLQTDALSWRPRKPSRLLDEAENDGTVQYWGMGEGAVLIDAPGERPLLMLSGAVPSLGRWASEAVIVIMNDLMTDRAIAVLDQHAPRLLALAGSDSALDAAIPVLRQRLDGTGLVALEAGMALEV